jgi:uncharacterized Fe-S cluster-containing radical SAM superfamily protein
MTSSSATPPIGSATNPIVMYSEASANCTHRCTFCAQNWVNRNGFLKPEVNDRVVDLVKANPGKCFRIYNHVVGEPLLNKRLEERLKTITVLPNAEVWVCTNGVLLDDARIESLLAAGLQNIWFSFFGSNREDYRKTTRVDLYERAHRHLLGLVSHLHRFRQGRIVCFSESAPGIHEKVRQMKHVFFEVARPVEAWDPEKPSQIRFICVSVNGEVTYDWKDSNFTRSRGNILSLTNAEVMDGYWRSWPKNTPET